MKPPLFRYLDPTSLPDALSLLAQHGDRAKVLAGGQSLLPLLNFRLARPEVLIDINRIEAVHVLHNEKGKLTIGATWRQRELERFPKLSEVNPLLAEALPLMGHFQIRNRATVCGSLAHADPAAELPAVAITEGVDLTIQQKNGHRVVQAHEFFVGPLTTVMEPDELLTHATFPPWRSGDGWAIEELARRQGDFALAGVVVLLTPDPSHRGFTSSRITVFGTGKTPQRMGRAETLFDGEPLSTSLLDVVVARVREDTEAGDDIHASGEYRRYVAGTLAKRALLRAAARAGLATEGV